MAQAEVRASTPGDPNLRAHEMFPLDTLHRCDLQHVAKCGCLTVSFEQMKEGRKEGIQPVLRLSNF